MSGQNSGHTVSGRRRGRGEAGLPTDPDSPPEDQVIRERALPESGATGSFQFGQWTPSGGWPQGNGRSALSSAAPAAAPAPAAPASASASQGSAAAAASQGSALPFPNSAPRVNYGLYGDAVFAAAPAAADAAAEAEAEAEELRNEEYFGVNGFPITTDDANYFADGDDIPAWQPSNDNIVYVQSQVEVIPASHGDSVKNTQEKIDSVASQPSQPVLPPLPPSPPADSGISPTFGGDVKTRTTKVRLEILTPDQQAKRIHGTEAFNRVNGDTRCSLCGFKLSERQPPPKGAAAAAAAATHIKWSYDHTLPVNLTALFFRCMFNTQRYNEAEINIMCLLGDISCFNCNYSKGQKRFITIPRDRDAKPNVAAIKEFLNKLLNANHRQGNTTLLVAINNISIAGDENFKRDHWLTTQTANIQRKVQRICDVLNTYVDKDKAYTKLKANASYINACQTLAKTEQNVMKKSEEFKLIVASLGETFPWKDNGRGTTDQINTMLAQLNDDATRRTIADANDRNCPFGVENSETFKHFTDADTSAARAAQLARNAREHLINKKLDAVKAAEEKQRAAQTEYDDAVDAAPGIKAPSRRAPGAKWLRIINAKAELDAANAELAKAEAELTAAQAGGVAAAAAPAPAPAPAPCRRKTYGGSRRYKQRKTLKKYRKGPKRATRRKGKRHTRRRT